VIGENDFLKIKQNTFIDGTTLDDSKIGVTTTVKNTGYDTVKIGIRYEWDIMIDGNDAARYRTKNPEGPWLEYETQWSSFNYTHYEITDYPFGTPTFYNLGSVIGPTYLTPPPTPPDLLQYASWSNGYLYAFNYTLQGYNLSYYDSAILYYWGNNLANAKVLAPGDSVMVTQYLFASLLSLTYQPDNLIKNWDQTTYIGDNIYNLTGIGQTKEQYTIPNNPAVYHIKIENDGNGSDGFIVNEYFQTRDNADIAETRQNWTVEYYDALVGGNNITAQVTGIGWNTGALNPGAYREIRMEVTPDALIPSYSSWYCDVLSTSVNDNSKQDLVATITIANRYYDIGPIEILMPADTIVAGTVVTPSVRIENFGNQPAINAMVFMSFDGYFGQVGLVAPLNPGQTVIRDFPVTWTATPGTYNAVVYSTWFQDENPTNDTMYDSFVVISAGISDVGVLQILAPIGTMTAGTAVTPQSIVKNFGSTPRDEVESFWVFFTFDSYRDSVYVTLMNGEEDTVDFTPWTAQVGYYDVISYTTLADDINRHNDTAYNELQVNPAVVHDVGVNQILAPTGTINSGTVVTPTAVVHNYGNIQEAEVPVYFTFGSYLSTRTISLAIGQTDTVEFDDWTASAGAYTGISYTALTTDQNFSNDTAQYRFSVIDTGMNDISIVSILVPTSGVITCNDYTPAVVIHNQTVSGTGSAAPCSVLVRITRYPAQMTSFCNIGVDTTNPICEYEEWLFTTVEVGSDTVYLPNWHPYWSDITWVLNPTYHKVYAEVSSPNDVNPDNNSLLNMFMVNGCAYDLQTNWTGLLDGYEPLYHETLEIRTYNVASVVSNPVGPTAQFRSKVKIIQENNQAIVYARYLDEELAPMTYSCLSYQSGWTPTEPGWYRVYSWIETRPGLDMIAENNAQEKYYYFVNLLPAQVTHNTNQSTQGNHGMSTAFELIGARPNPFNNTTNISWQIPVSALVKLTVYDATGRTIKTLENNSYPAGNYNTTWNRTDDANQRVAAGIYFYEIKANNYTARQKLVIK